MWIIFCRRSTQLKAEFNQNTSQLNIFSLNKYPIAENSNDYFIQFAMQYILSGKSIIEICEHNSSIAKGLGRYNVCGRL